jgi:lipid-binding SYLF domain-containing protein
MKTMIISLLLIGAALPMRADEKAELDRRVISLTSKFETMQQQADKRIPAAVLRKAKGIILLDRTRAGFLFA